MKKAIFIDGEHQYDLLEEEETAYLFYSNNSMWHYPEQLILSLTNDGNGFVLGGDALTKGRLDYSQSIYLYILLAAVKDQSIFVADNFKEI